MPNVLPALDRSWFTVYSPPHILSGDVELSRSVAFMDTLKFFHVRFAPRQPAVTIRITR